MFKLHCTFVLLAAGLSAQPQVTYFAASLRGSQVVPATPSSARAWATLRLDPATGDVYAYLAATGLTPSTVYLRNGAPGVIGAVILQLAGGPSVWTARATLTPADVAVVMGGNSYLELSSIAFPGGEIRGQLVVPAASRFSATLDGFQMTPPVTTSATGTAVVFLHEPDNVLTYTITSQGLQAPTAAHLHQGPAGLPGTMLLSLRGTAGTYCGAAPLSSSQLTALKAGQLYFDIHTPAHSNGEIRGQILPVVSSFAAALDGAQEVPPVVTSAIGQACLTINANNTVSYTVRTQGLQNVVSADVERGAPGTVGSPVFVLSGGPAVFSGTSPVLTPAQLADARNGLWYVNVSTLAQSGGEIRGQVAVADLPSTYGGACPDGAGRRAEAGTQGAACLGSGVLVTLHDGPPARPASVLLGASRDAISVLTLPLSLSFLNAPSCHLLHDLLPVSFVTATDGAGCAESLISLPFLPALRGLNVYASWLVADAGAPGGLVTSNGLQVPLQ